MTTRTRKKTLSRQQYERRADGRIVRVEVSLNATKPGDIFIADHLAELPPDTTKSDYLRDALLDKITADRHETDTDKKIAEMLNEINELKAMITELMRREITVQMVQAAQVIVGPAQPETHNSSGIDMSRPRTRPKLARGPVVEDATHDVTDEFDAVALAREMARSVGNFGKSKQSATGAEE